MNIMKKIVFCGVVIFSLSSSIIAHAKVDGVSYRCPTIEEAGEMDVRTSINDKTVHWEKKYNESIHHDNPIEFKKVILTNKDNNSYDMSVTCIYRTQQNKKAILSPLSSWHWYVDGVAEKVIGNNWRKSAKGNFECDSSIKNCSFIFR